MYTQTQYPLKGLDTGTSLALITLYNFCLCASSVTAAKAGRVKSRVAFASDHPRRGSAPLVTNAHLNALSIFFCALDSSFIFSLFLASACYSNNNNKNLEWNLMYYFLFFDFGFHVKI